MSRSECWWSGGTEGGIAKKLKTATHKPCQSKVGHQSRCEWTGKAVTTQNSRLMTLTTIISLIQTSLDDHPTTTCCQHRLPTSRGRNIPKAHSQHNLFHARHRRPDVNPFGGAPLTARRLSSKSRSPAEKCPPDPLHPRFPTKPTPRLISLQPSVILLVCGLRDSSLEHILEPPRANFRLRRQRPPLTQCPFPHLTPALRWKLCCKPFLP